MRIDYIIAKAERGLTRGEKTAVVGGTAAGLGGIVGEAVNVERHNDIARKVRANRMMATPSQVRGLKAAKRNVYASRGLWGAGALTAVGAYGHRSARLNQKD